MPLILDAKIGDLVYVMHDFWDVWDHQSNVANQYEADTFVELTPVIVLSKRYRLPGDLVPHVNPVYEVTTGLRNFWMVSKYV